MSKETERLIHILLCEEIGAEKVPDVTERVLERALQRRRRSWRRGVSVPVRQFFQRPRLPLSGRAWQRVATVAALLVVCVLAVWWTTGRRYPAPEASGSYKLLDAAEVRRGAVLVTEDQPASLALGGYCQVRLEPNTALRIEGRKGAEEVLLEKGAVKCDVNPGVGAFAVRSRVGTVSVTGTSFSASLLERKTAETGPGSPAAVWMLAVAVAAGSVSVDYNGSVFKLSAGLQQVFGEEPGAGPNQPVSPGGTGKVTITGMARALGEASGNLNPGVANATLTVTANDTKVVYYVSGWAGVILAKQADGKKAEVTGVLVEKDGRKTITAASVGVKIIVVEEEPPQKPPH
ncbi:MAG: FecR domain-containing protein [Thermoguttaceae bacterium]